MECARTIKMIVNMVEEREKEKALEEQRIRKEKNKKNAIQLCDTEINNYLIDNATRGKLGCCIEIAHCGSAENFRMANICIGRVYIGEIEYDYETFIQYLANNGYEIKIDEDDFYPVSDSKIENVQTISIIPNPPCE